MAPPSLTFSMVEKHSHEATFDFLGTFLGKVQDSDPIPATKFVQLGTAYLSPVQC